MTEGPVVTLSSQLASAFWQRFRSDWATALDEALKKGLVTVDPPSQAVLDCIPHLHLILQVHPCPLTGITPSGRAIVRAGMGTCGLPWFAECWIGWREDPAQLVIWYPINAPFPIPFAREEAEDQGCA